MVQLALPVRPGLDFLQLGQKLFPGTYLVAKQFEHLFFKENTRQKKKVKIQGLGQWEYSKVVNPTGYSSRDRAFKTRRFTNGPLTLSICLSTNRWLKGVISGMP